MKPERWNRIQEAYHGAEALGGAERQHYLDDACAGDRSLRLQVESLLLCGEGEELDVAVERAAAAVAGAATSSSLSIAGTIGNYSIVERLGEGGMGVVYEAEQQNPRRRVALKLIQAGRYASDRIRRLFQREVEALGRLTHPGIATIYESGTAADGQPFLAMELVKGVPLNEWFQRQPPLPDIRKEHVRSRIALFRSICDAVGYAHQNGVIHRDIKPSNIMVLEEDEAQGTSLSAAGVKILDFGLARFTENYGEATVATEVGVVQGSIPYMSPEQARGESGRIDLRSDVYALGILLYWLLTSHHPYLDKSEGLTRSLANISEAPPKPFRHWGVRSDEDLETIVGKALEKEPERRYQSVAALTADLDRYLADLPVEARAPTTLYQVRKLVQRHRAAFGALVALLVFIVGFATTTLIQSRRVRAERDRANQEAATAKQISDFLVDLFRQTNPAETKGELTARELLSSGRERARKEVGNQPELYARLLDRIGSAYTVLGPLSEAQKIFEESLRVRAQAFGPDSSGSADSFTGLANVFYNSGDLAGSARASRRAVEIDEKRLGTASPRLAADLADLSNALSAQGDFAAAEPLMRRAVEIDRQPGKTVSSGAAGRLHFLGNLLRREAKWREAVPVLRTAVEQLRATGGELDANGALNELGMTLNQVGESKEAEEVLRRTLTGARQIYGPEHGNVAMVENNIAFALIEQGRYAESETTARDALRIFRKSMGENHPRETDMLRAIALSLDGQGRMEEAGALFRRYLAMTEKAYGSDHMLTANASIWMARHEVRAGQPHAALTQLDAAITTLRAKGRADSYEWAVAERARGEAFSELGEWKATESSLTRAYQWLAANLGDGHPETRKTLEPLARACDATGQTKRALQLRKALATR